MPRSLGLDVGNRRIGLAVSDALKVIARPLEVLDRRQHDAVAYILHVVIAQQVDEIIVGCPYHADGRVGEQALVVQRFVDLLRMRAQVPVLLVDERFSTGQAKEIISAKKRKKQDIHDDAVAAAVILQRYLDEKRPAQDEPDEYEALDDQL